MSRRGTMPPKRGATSYARGVTRGATRGGATQRDRCVSAPSREGMTSGRGGAAPSRGRTQPPIRGGTARGRGGRQPVGRGSPPKTPAPSKKTNIVTEVVETVSSTTVIEPEMEPEVANIFPGYEVPEGYQVCPPPRTLMDASPPRQGLHSLYTPLPVQPPTVQRAVRQRTMKRRPQKSPMNIMDMSLPRNLSPSALPCPPSPSLMDEPSSPVHFKSPPRSYLDMTPPRGIQTPMRPRSPQLMGFDTPPQPRQPPGAINFAEFEDFYCPDQESYGDADEEFDELCDEDESIPSHYMGSFPPSSTSGSPRYEASSYSPRYGTPTSPLGSQERPATWPRSQRRQMCPYGDISTGPMIPSPPSAGLTSPCVTSDETDYFETEESEESLVEVCPMEAPSMEDSPIEMQRAIRVRKQPSDSTPLSDCPEVAEPVYFDTPSWSSEIDDQFDKWRFTPGPTGSGRREELCMTPGAYRRLGKAEKEAEYRAMQRLYDQDKARKDSEMRRQGREEVEWRRTPGSPQEGCSYWPSAQPQRWTPTARRKLSF